ncbi:putative zinc ribbon domain protein [Clostridium liquoris]|jgi:hypothetical protein|uniref:Putative zinc ribbon domain protein n=1 Tax=Clostridium liquoris TaxID=1289519 RepID=A0A2T0B0U2_9CLOT|nr:C4-type zinc ribbon domain-containing protein [Clostridium liquoris]PRR77224.1 putative zinc ribbon domain protein [Clostridium liquoris]
MENIQLLLFLQENYNKMDKSYKILKDNPHISMLNKMKEEFNKLKKKYINKKNQLESINKKYCLLNDEIEALKKEVKEDDYILYNKCGNDLKMITTLQRDIEKKNKTIEEKENQAMALLEKEEVITNEIASLGKTLEKIRDEFNSYKENADKAQSKVKEEFERCKNEINVIRNKIPLELLKDFDEIKAQKKVAVALLQKNVCTGCKIKVSAITLDEINKGKEIVHCDNCGRILCKANLKDAE